jgi:SPP1 family predicted phage head-tail adaptor
MNINGEPTNPGELRTRITLARRNIVKQPGGAQKYEPVSIATVYAKWVNLHGSEVWQAATVNAVQPATVFIRYRGDIDTTCLVILNGTIYEIVAMDNVRQRNEYIELKVQATGAG